MCMIYNDPFILPFIKRSHVKIIKVFSSMNKIACLKKANVQTILFSKAVSKVAVIKKNSTEQGLTRFENIQTRSETMNLKNTTS